MSNKCYVFSVEKYKSDDIDGISKHNLRDFKDLENAESKNGNVDFSRSKSNLHLGPAKNSKQFRSMIFNRIRRDQKPPKKPQLIKKSTNVFVDLVFSASPTYFFKGLNDSDMEWWDNLKVGHPDYKKEIAKVWETFDTEAFEAWKAKVLEFVELNKDEFKDLTVSFDFHLDEKTAHAVLTLVPMVGDKVNCKQFYTPQRLATWRNQLDSLMAPLGLDRQKDEGPTPKDDQEAFYKAQANEKDISKPPKIKIPEPLTENDVFKVENKGIFFPTKVKKQIIPTENILKYQNSREVKQKEVFNFFKDFYDNNKYKINAFEKLKAKDKSLVKELNKMKAKIDKLELEKQASLLRSIDCIAVIEAMGFKTQKEGTYTRFNTDNYNVVINPDNRFFDNKADKGGFGAIDLLINVFGMKFKEAKEFLTNQFGAGKTADTILLYPAKAKEEIEKNLINEIKEVPKEVPANIENVKKYLSEIRKIDPMLVDVLADKKLIYADSKNNLLFPNHDRTFAVERGTYKGLENKHKVAKGHADFIKFNFGHAKVNEIYLFESPIDALSFKTLNPQKNGLYVSINGSMMINEIHQLNLDTFSKVHLCFDKDVQGKKFRDKISAQTSSPVEVHIPLNKDFNEDILNGYSKQSTNTSVVESRDPTTATGTVGETNPTEQDTTKRNYSTRGRIPKKS